MEDGLLLGHRTFFDFGCGRGDDIRLLTQQGVPATGWDPVHRPEVEHSPADIVNLGYVVNVIEDAAERAATLRQAWSLAKRVLVVAARLQNDGRDTVGDIFEDGVLTRRGTFQKFYEPAELASWIESTLGVTPMAAAPGIFYVFQDDQLRESFAASRVRRAPTRARASPDAAFVEHRDLLQPLVDFLNERGRLPGPDEFPGADAIVKALGSLRRAYNVIRRAVGEASWSTVETLRSEDLLVYLALARLHRRPRFASLPPELQRDVRSFFRSYERACLLADEVLLAVGNAALVDRSCRTSPVGKLTPAALYVHVTAMNAIPPLLRVYEGCARSYVGAVDGANIVKIHRGEPRISYLSYPLFEKAPHPALATSLVVPLQTFRLETHDYRTSKNPPILHRKETFVALDHPLRKRFARLTRQEEQAGLFEDVATIGTKNGWEDLLLRRRLRLEGHRLVHTQA
jgi:DNA phosphorothioation-associated putative methyltransferase